MRETIQVSELENERPRTWFRTWLWLFAVAVFALGLFLFLADERNRAMLFQATGHVTHGEKFGISIGMAAANAAGVAQSMHLQRRDLILEPLASCGGRIVRQDEVVEEFEDESFRNGYICTISRNNRVITVGWHFCPYCP